MLEDNTILIRNNEILATEMEGETVMMSVENGEYYSLSPIGTRIWEILKNKMNFKQLVEKLMQEYDVDYNTCKEDTAEFVNELIKKKLVILKG